MPGGVFGPRWRESWLEYLPSRKNTKEKERRRRGVSESRNWYICPFLWAFQARHVDNSNADRRRSRLHARRYIKRIVRYEKIKYRLGARNSFVRFISDRTIVSETTDTRRPVPAHHATFFFFPPLVYYINGTRSTFMRREARGIESFFPFFCFYLESARRCEKCIWFYSSGVRCFLSFSTRNLAPINARTFPCNRFQSCRCTEDGFFICR